MLLEASWMFETSSKHSGSHSPKAVALFNYGSLSLSNFALLSEFIIFCEIQSFNYQMLTCRSLLALLSSCSAGAGEFASLSSEHV